MTTRVRLSSLTAFALLTLACVVDNISGPSVVAPNSPATYRMTFHAGSCAAYNIARGVLLIDVPTGWQFQSATFTGVLNGFPASGGGELLTPCSGAPWGSPAPSTPPGYSRLCVQTPVVYGFQLTDSVQVTVSLLTGTTFGHYTLRWFAAATYPLDNPLGLCLQEQPSLFDVTVAAHEAAAIPALSLPALLLLSLALALSGLVALRHPPA